MRIAILLLFAITTLASCNSNADNAFRKYLSPQNLALQSFTIDITKDTAIKTNGGIVINIPANSIEADQTNVTLQVREALTINDMVKAGLFTETKKGILSSGGMLNVSTKEKSSIKKGLKVSVPTKFTKAGMELYKGEEEDGKIIWENNEQIASVPVDMNVSGEKLFTTNCASCHAVEKHVTAPALAHISKRRSREWLHAFTRNNQELLIAGDGYACCIYNKWNKAPMNNFSSFSDTAIDAIYNYIEKVSEELAIPFDPNKNADCDSCSETSKYISELIKQRNALTGENGKMVDGIENARRNEMGASSKISPIPYYADYYQFTIVAYGWYNIDMLLDGRPGIEMSELKVKLNVPDGVKMNLSLVIPSTNTFAEGGYLQGNEEYGFYNVNGQVPLPQQEVAYIIAMGEGDGKMYYAKQQFISSRKQTIVINVQESNKEEINRMVESMQLTDVKIKVDETKNFDSIKKIDEELRRLNSICNCASADTDSAYAVPPVQQP